MSRLREAKLFHELRRRQIAVVVQGCVEGRDHVLQRGIVGRSTELTNALGEKVLRRVPHEQIASLDIRAPADATSEGRRQHQGPTARDGFAARYVEDLH